MGNTGELCGKAYPSGQAAFYNNRKYAAGAMRLFGRPVAAAKNQK